MAELYYGNGECTIEGAGIKGVQIKYRGNIKVEKTAGDGYLMMHSDQYKGILFFPNVDTKIQVAGGLHELFNYNGQLRITSLIVADNNGERIVSGIRRVMDYSEIIESTAETMTMKSEELSAGYSSSKRINKTGYIIENLHTRDKDTPFFLLDGSLYEGCYHIHLKDSSCMTGMVHDENSQDLYFKQVTDGKVIDKLIPTKNPSHVPPVLKLREKENR